LADNKIFYAMCDLYKSLCAQKSHPEASANLDLLLRKRVGSLSMSELINIVQPKKGGSEIGKMRAWFLQFHVKCYMGVAFPAHDEMESEILTRLMRALKDRIDLSSTLFQMVIMNIAAESVAYDKAEANNDPARNAQGYFFFLRHNVRTFIALLTHFHSDLLDHSREELASNQEMTRSGKIPPVSEVVMFSLRLYSLWFTKNWPFLQKCMENDDPDALTAYHIRELFGLLAAVLNLVFEQYPLNDVRSALWVFCRCMTS